jgi:hypothetical protein
MPKGKDDRKKKQNEEANLSAAYNQMRREETLGGLYVRGLNIQYTGVEPYGAVTSKRNQTTGRVEGYLPEGVYTPDRPGVASARTQRRAAAAQLAANKKRKATMFQNKARAR